MKKTSKQRLVTAVLGLTIASMSTPAFASAYQIKEGDSLWKIGKSQHVSVGSLRAANPGLAVYNLKIGTNISIPGRSYAVKQNETFWTISRKLGISMTALINENPKVNPKNVYPGLTLMLPAKSTTLVEGLSTKPTAASQTSAQKAVTHAGTGNKLAYKHSLDIVATAYSGAAEENGGYAGIDYFGNALKVGTIAVDPKIIPLGTKVYITGYSSKDLPAGGMIATATDTGSAIKGNRVDIYLPGSRQRVSNFGMQNVKVYVLK
jgi:3D (Asp-Asp-Asp) domain-containing protein/LysM repeat protein